MENEKIVNFRGNVDSHKDDNEKELERIQKESEEVIEAMNKKEPKVITITMGINGDKTPINIETKDNSNVTLDDIMYFVAALDVNNFAHLIQRAILSNSSADEVLAVYSMLEENRINTVNATITNMLKTQSNINPNPIYKEIYSIILEEAKQAQEFMKQMQSKNDSGIIIPH